MAYACRRFVVCFTLVSSLAACHAENHDTTNPVDGSTKHAGSGAPAAGSGGARDSKAGRGGSQSNAGRAGASGEPVDDEHMDAGVDAEVGSDAAAGPGPGGESGRGAAGASSAGGGATDDPDAATSDASTPVGGSGGSGGAMPVAGGTAGGMGPAPTGDGTYLSDTDRNTDGVNLSPDRLSGEWLGLGTWGVRSTRAISAHQGVVYFEAYAPLDYFQIGVATASADLGRGAGAGDQGFSVDVGGQTVIGGDGTNFTPSPDGAYGFVLDYRGDHPTVYLIAGTASSPSLVGSYPLAQLSAPLFIHLSGMRRKEGYQVTINPGNDTVNRPFVFDAKAVLSGQGQMALADALVLGWGASHQSVFNMPPQIQLGANPQASIALGQSVTLTAAASDPEDGSLDAQIAWDVLSTGNGPEHVHATGPSFTFTPGVIGHHPIRASVTDAGGKYAEQLVTVEATGDQPQLTDVKLVLEGDLSGAGIQLSPTQLAAHWTQPDKYGVRANQGLYKGFWYVEGHRLTPAANQAIGLVIGGVSLNPYHFNITPPSCSVNTAVPGIYQNLIVKSELSGVEVEYYGLAVDYRGDYPIVHIIMAGMLVRTLELKDATVPIYPMLYGNPTGAGVPWDMEINFGGTAFHEHPADVLRAAGVNADDLVLCWGRANAACAH